MANTWTTPMNKEKVKHGINRKGRHARKGHTVCELSAPPKFLCQILVTQVRLVQGIS